MADADLGVDEGDEGGDDDAGERQDQRGAPALVLALVEEVDEGSDPEHYEDGAEGVEALVADAAGFAEEEGTGDEGEDGDRDREDEDVAPAEGVGNEAADDGADEQADGDDAAVESHGPAALTGRKCADDEAGAGGLQHGGADALEDAGGDEVAEPGAEEADEPADAKKSEAGERDALAADEIGEAAEGQHETVHADEVGECDPLDGQQVGVEAPGDAREGDVDAAGVEGGDEDAGADDKHHGPLVARAGAVLNGCDYWSPLWPTAAGAGD